MLAMWSLQDVLNWLDENKLGSLVPTFRIHKIDGKELDRIREKNDSKVSFLKFSIFEFKLILINSDLETDRGSKRTARPVTNSVTKSRIYLLVSAMLKLVCFPHSCLPERNSTSSQSRLSFPTAQHPSQKYRSAYPILKGSIYFSIKSAMYAVPRFFHIQYYYITLYIYV